MDLIKTFIQLLLGTTITSCIICAIILFIIQKSVEKIASTLQRKYELKFDKEIEKLKSLLDNKNHVSKTQFDVEFSIYQQLSKAFFEMLISLDTVHSLNYDVFDNGIRQDKKMVADFYFSAAEKTTIAQNILRENAAFISKSFFDQYDYILSECLKLIWEYKDEIVSDDYSETIQDVSWNVYHGQIVQELQKQHDKINDELREYLNSLTIVE